MQSYVGHVDSVSPWGCRSLVSVCVYPDEELVPGRAPGQTLFLAGSPFREPEPEPEL